MDFLARCPRCGMPIKERENRKTGQAFTGCSAFPSCSWTQAGPREFFNQGDADELEEQEQEARRDGGPDNPDYFPMGDEFGGHNRD